MVCFLYCARSHSCCYFGIKYITLCIVSKCVYIMIMIYMRYGLIFVFFLYICGVSASFSLLCVFICYK